MKKILAINGLPVHHEMFGYIMDFCNTYQFDLDVCLGTYPDLGWMDFYATMFNYQMVAFENLRVDDYVLIFLLTDNDMLIDEKWLPKTVAIVHTNDRDRAPGNKARFKLSTMPFKNRNIDFAYPCYPIINFKDKKAILDSHKDINVAVIGGNCESPSDYSFIKSKQKIIYNIMSRKRNLIFCDIYNNPRKKACNILVDVSAVTMINILKASHYVLIGTNCQRHLNGHTISGAIPLALSTGCTILIPEVMKKFYPIQSYITYQVSQELHLNPAPDLSAVFKDLDQAINKRDALIHAFIDWVHL